MVSIKERHVNSDRLDATVETELIYLMQKFGLGDNSLAPSELIAIVGEAFSEFAARRGELQELKKHYHGDVR